MRIREVGGALLRWAGPGRWAALVGLSLALAVVLDGIRAPAALLLGPLAAGVLFGWKGAVAPPPRRVFAAAQALVGCLIAASATAGFWSGVVEHLPVYVALAASTLVVTFGFGWLLTARGWLAGTTAIWGLAPGASTAMVLMSDAFGGDRRLVAVIQYLRLLIVALLAMGLAQLKGAAPGRSPTDWFDLGEPVSVALTLAFAGVAGWLGKVSRLPAGIFLVPMLAGSALQAMGVVRLDLPVVIAAFAYAVIGWSIGLGFTRDALVYSARMLPRILAVLAAVLVCCGMMAAGVRAATGVDWLTAWLATSPGGTDTILIIATSTPVDLPFILGGQLVRFLMVLAVGPVLARMLARKLTAGPAPFEPVAGPPQYRTPPVESAHDR